MKRVSFKVAKAIKEIGYPQECDMYYPVPPKYQDIGREIAQPLYMEVWLWLWREKKIPISILCDEDNLLDEHWYPNSEAAVGYIGSFTDVVFHKDPEETIIAAIEHLIDNNLTYFNSTDIDSGENM